MKNEFPSNSVKMWTQTIKGPTMYSVSSQSCRTLDRARLFCFLSVSKLCFDSVFSSSFLSGNDSLTKPLEPEQKHDSVL